jgi:hypothetical protein
MIAAIGSPPQQEHLSKLAFLREEKGPDGAELCRRSSARTRSIEQEA